MTGREWGWGEGVVVVVVCVCVCVYTWSVHPLLTFSNELALLALFRSSAKVRQAIVDSFNSPSPRPEVRRGVLTVY